MQVKQDARYDANVGVLVARFQVAALHEAHKELIDYVVERHDRVVVFLGLSPTGSTIRNPLDFTARKQLLLSEYPDITVLYIKDCASDELWSDRLDEQIEAVLGPNDNALLYGGRDSFIESYTGHFPTEVLESDTYVSGTDIRNQISRSTKSSPEFRQGAIWATFQRYPTVFTTVDIAIFRFNFEKILLGRKPDETEYRFVGGFSQPDGRSFEVDAYREMSEETGLQHPAGSGCMTYLGSYAIPDWRYASEVDGIKTLLFACEPQGTPRPQDDIVELRWFDIDEDIPLVPQHEELLVAARKHAELNTANY